MRNLLLGSLAVVLCVVEVPYVIGKTAALQEYPVPAGSHPHDVAPAADGTVWYTAQATGELGRLDPTTGKTRHISLGQGSRPHGVIVGPDGAPWITDGGLNAIVRVDPKTDEVHVFPLPKDREGANLNTATFDRRGVLWFTGQRGIYGYVDPKVGQVQVFDAPRGTGPYGIATAPDGMVYYASLAGSYIAQVNLQTGAATVLDPPTARQGARRVWADSQSRIWVSEWNAGQVAMYDPSTGQWREWRHRVRTQGPMPSMWTTRTWCGSVTSARTRWSGLIRHGKRSKRFPSLVQARMCGNYLGELTRCGAPSLGRTNLSWYEYGRLSEESCG